MPICIHLSTSPFLPVNVGTRVVSETVPFSPIPTGSFETFRDALPSTWLIRSHFRTLCYICSPGVNPSGFRIPLRGSLVRAPFHVGCLCHHVDPPDAFPRTPRVFLSARMRCFSFENTEYPCEVAPHHHHMSQVTKGDLWNQCCFFSTAFVSPERVPGFSPPLKCSSVVSVTILACPRASLIKFCPRIIMIFFWWGGCKCASICANLVLIPPFGGGYWNALRTLSLREGARMPSGHIFTKG